MKKYLSIIACMLALVCVLSGCSKEVTVDATGLVHMTLSGPATTMTEEGYTATLVAAEHYDLPQTISVVMEGQEGEATYTFDPATGELNIPEVVGAITITGEATESLVGTWAASIDFGGILTQSMGDDESAEYFDFSDLVIDMTLTFNADGTYSLVSDEASISTMVTNLSTAIKDGMNSMVADLLKDMGYDMSVEDFMALAGMDLNTMVDELMTQLDPEKMVGELTADGTYEVRDGQLYLDDDGCAYTLKDGVLTLEAPADVDEAMAAYMFPWTLTRVG